MNLLKLHSVPLFLIFTSLFVSLLSDDATLLFRYERTEILNFEFWRLFTAHIVHSGYEHLFLNLLALIIIWLIIYRFANTSEWWLTLLVSNLGISLSFLFFMSNLEWYVGLSGVLHSLVVFGSISAILQGRKEFYLLLVFILLKLVFEQFFGSVSKDFVSIESSVVLNAHLYGAIMGIVCAAVLQIYKKQNKIDP
jgi:rhomboid family GlyGly-CTERM serine protease